MTYLPRVVDRELGRALGFAGAVLIEGPRTCGKSATGRHNSSSWVQLDIDPAARLRAEVDRALLLEGSTPRFLDEWQIEPELWDQVKRCHTTETIEADKLTRLSNALVVVTAGRYGYTRTDGVKVVPIGALGP